MGNLSGTSKEQESSGYCSKLLIRSSYLFCQLMRLRLMPLYPGLRLSTFILNFSPSTVTVFKFV